MATSHTRQNLTERTSIFARRVRIWVRRLPKDFLIIDDIKQLLRSSGSVGANYIEANESLGKKNCAMHMKICRKEAKESRFWLQQLEISLEPTLEQERVFLAQEAHELTCIFHAIVDKYYS